MAPLAIAPHEGIHMKELTHQGTAPTDGTELAIDYTPDKPQQQTEAEPSGRATPCGGGTDAGASDGDGEHTCPAWPSFLQATLDGEVAAAMCTTNPTIEA